MRWAWGLAVALLAAACSASSQPATTPASVPTTAPTTTTTPTTLATPTTVDRLTEIEAIYQDLEERRLDALYRGDRETFSALHANDAYLQTSMELFDLMEFIAPPESARLGVVRVLNETDTCMALEVEKDLVGVLAGADSAAVGIVVLEKLEPGWGISYTGEGWLCDGPHPLS